MSASGDVRDLRAQVRASYTPEKRHEEATSDPLAFLLYRPLSFWLTPVLAQLGVSANQVSSLSIALALLLPLVACLGGSAGAFAVAFAGFSFQVLDCVDGNLARLRGRSSRVGQLLDSTASGLFWTSYLVALGLLASSEPATSELLSSFGEVPIGSRVLTLAREHGVAVGLSLALFRVVQKCLEDDTEAALGARVRWEPPSRAPRGFSLGTLGKMLEHVFAFGGLAIAGATSHVGLFLIVVATWQLSLLGLWLPRWIFFIWTRAREETESP